MQAKVLIDLCGVGCMTTIASVLIRRGKFGQSREDHVKMEAESEDATSNQGTFRIAGNHQSL